ncbi:hypothetical protein JW766_02880 [Candidatus Dojkabacteria bacterium]|nr:hypothetical protein [Candidatus Dojkabacteria bacterium]
MPEEGLQDRKREKGVHELVKDAEKGRKAPLPEKFKKSGKNALKMILYYSAPLISIAIFLLILVLGTIPAVKGIVQSNNEIEEKNGEIKELEKQIKVLEALRLNEADVNMDLATIDKIVPSEKTQVAKFVGEIEEMAKLYNLEESKYESGETIEKLEEEIEEELKKESAAIIHIPTSSEYIATFEDIKEFLNALYYKDDFIIVSSLDMQGYEAREYQAGRQREMGEQVTIDTTIPVTEWTMKVTFEKYQFSEGFSKYLEENLVSMQSKPNEETLIFIREKYSSQ